VKNRFILYFLAVGILSAAPALADRISASSMEQNGKPLSVRELPNEGVFQGVSFGRNFGSSQFDEAISGFQGKDLDEGGKVSFLKGLLNSDSIEDGTTWSFFELGQKNGVHFVKSHRKDAEKHHPIKVGHDEPAPTTTAIPEPNTFTLLLLGMGVLGMILYRRSLPQ
jgi:hypothetical protein